MILLFEDTPINPARDIDHDLIEFKVAVQSAYYREMMEHMRELGVKIPITGTNWVSPPDELRTQLVTDFIDTHPYFYDWNWGEFEKKCMNRSITQDRMFYLSDSCLRTNAAMPTYVSEWDVPWPNEFRADSVIYTAAFGMFQGWSGFAIHTYSYSAHLERMNMLGLEISAQKVGNVPYRQGVFSAWNDPAKFGLFYHAALITRRGDVKKGEDLRAIPLQGGKAEWDRSVVALCTENKAAVVTVNGSEGLPEMRYEDKGEYVISDTGELYRNFKNHYGKVDTERTKCAFGFLGENGEVVLDGMKVRCKTDFAVIAASSLTDKTIGRSDNILLTAVGRAQNTGAKFDQEVMLEAGRPPILIENIEAEIELETVYSDLRVWAVSAEGYYIGTVPAVWENGRLKIRLGEVSQSMYYLIVRS